MIWPKKQWSTGFWTGHKPYLGPTHTTTTRTTSRRLWTRTTCTWVTRSSLTYKRRKGLHFPDQSFRMVKPLKRTTGAAIGILNCTSILLHRLLRISLRLKTWRRRPRSILRGSTSNSAPQRFLKPQSKTSKPTWIAETGWTTSSRRRGSPLR